MVLSKHHRVLFSTARIIPFCSLRLPLLCGTITHMSRLSWLLVLVTLVVGLGAGLYVGWVVSPVEYTDTDPASLAQIYKDDYVLIIATRYAGDGNLETARAGLQTLGFAEAGADVVDVAQRFIATRQPESDIRRLVALAAGLGPLPAELLPYAP